MIRITIEKFNAEQDDYTKRGVVFDDAASTEDIFALVSNTLDQIRNGKES